ncbi:MAG TPA: hypothetical protein VKB88_25045 [Bryobacteraceae bacterium]|nr:hypothetical protein [Bryobacteraceae bacterium]
MSRPDDVDRDALLLGHTAGELTAEQEKTLLEAAAADQDLFDQVMEADALREALAVPEERRRAAAVLNSWDRRGPAAQPEPEPERAPYAALAAPPRYSRPSLAADVLRSVVSTLATTVALRLGYTALAAAGATFASAPGAAAPGAPAVLHLVHAAIAGLLLAVQFTGFFQPQTISAREHPIASQCLAQFIAGWRWAWALWLALYTWLWVLAALGRNPYPVADVLNCLTSFPLFWCFFVLDKPSVPAPGQPQRNAAFRKAVGVTWGIGAGVALLATAGRLHVWGLNEFCLGFMGIYDGLAIAFLVGRFDSHWIRVPRWMLAPLYGYALIQMIYVFFFNLPPAWQIYTYLVALLFKICLFLVVTHLLHAGHLRIYLEAAEDGKLGPPAVGAS